MNEERWRKSEHSNPNGACVEIGDGPGIIGIRDSRQRDTVLRFRPDVFRKFTDKIKEQT